MFWLGSALVGYLVLVAAMFLLQRSLLYPAGKERPDLAQAGFDGFREVRTTTDDGLSLLHWYRPPGRPGAPVVVVFHGNAGHIGHRASKYGVFAEAGFGVFLVGYRGYGGNPGQPTEEGLTQDGRSVLDWLSGQDLPAGHLIYYGESLGTAVAVRLASESPALLALVLEAPPSSIADVAAAVYWYVPTRLLLHDKWESDKRIGAVAAPVMIVHGGQDRVVPQRFGKKLLAAAKEPKVGIFPPGAGHGNLLENPDTLGSIIAFMTRNGGSS